MIIYNKGMRLWDPVNDQYVEIFNYVGCGLYLCIITGFVGDGSELSILGYCPVAKIELDKMEFNENAEVIN